MRCPECKAHKNRGRPEEYSMPELLTHMMEEHPIPMLKEARRILKEQAFEDTEVIVKPPVKHGP